MATMMRGAELPPRLQDEAKRRYVYRWTSENRHRVSAWLGVRGGPTLPLISDAEWLERTVFYVRRDRRAFDRRVRHCMTLSSADVARSFVD